MRIVVIGCRGFLGATFSSIATARGHRLLGVARASQPDPDFAGEFVSADASVADLAGVLRRFSPDVVLHAAGSASVSASLAAPLDDLRAALLTFASTLDAVRRAGLGCLVLFPSSAAVYGNPSSLPVAEDAPPAPLSPYGFHKLACELLAREYAEVYGVRVAIARIFSLYGPRQRRLLLWELFTQASRNPQISLEGTGEETRDYLHADDACAALLDFANLPPKPALAIVNLASGERTRIADLANLVVATIAPGKPVVFREGQRPGDPRDWQADVRRLAQLRTGHPRPLALGVSETLRVWAKRG